MLAHPASPRQRAAAATPPRPSEPACPCPRPQELPPALGRLTRLTALALRGNPLPPPLLRLLDAHGDLAVVTSLLNPAAAAVDLSECGFERLPPELAARGERGALRELVLTNNKLTDLPAVRRAGCPRAPRFVQGSA